MMCRRPAELAFPRISCKHVGHLQTVGRSFRNLQPQNEKMPGRAGDRSRPGVKHVLGSAPLFRPRTPAPPRSSARAFFESSHPGGIHRGGGFSPRRLVERRSPCRRRPMAHGAPVRFGHGLRKKPDRYVGRGKIAAAGDTAGGTTDLATRLVAPRPPRGSAGLFAGRGTAWKQRMLDVLGNAHRQDLCATANLLRTSDAHRTDKSAPRQSALIRFMNAQRLHRSVIATRYLDAFDRAR